jgi:hypothetical protein
MESGRTQGWRNSFRPSRRQRRSPKRSWPMGPHVSAGTLNPHLPKRTINSKQVLDWLDEADR